MKRITVLLISLTAVLLLAGLCSCKQEVAPEKYADNIPQWDKSEQGLQNLPDINTAGTETGVTGALKDGVNHPPVFQSANNLIVMVCEGLTSELIEKAVSQYGDLILQSLPVKGNTISKFSRADGMTLAQYSINWLDKTKTGIMAWGETSSNSMRRMTTGDGNDAERADVNYKQFMINPPLVYIMGNGDFKEAFAADSLNNMYKAGGYAVSTIDEAIPLYKNDEVEFNAPGHPTKYSAVRKLYTIFGDGTTLPSYRREMAFSLAWMQSVMNEDGFCLLSTYSSSSDLEEKDVKEFDEGVAIAVKYVLENPDTVLLICGCPTDGSEETVCFYGIGPKLTTQATLFECISALYK